VNTVPLVTEISEEQQMTEFSLHKFKFFCSYNEVSETQEDMAEACSKYVWEEKCIQSLGRKL
jgi:hypothetical protein